MPATYPLDTTGLNPACLVTDELHTLTEVNANPYRLIVPTFAPFYLDNLELEHIDDLGQATPLIEGLHYGLSLIYLAGSKSIGKMLYGAISINANFLNGTINLKKYQTIGGNWTADSNYVLASIAAQVYNPRVTAWDNVTNVQTIFPPINHDHTLDYVYGYQDLITAIQGIGAQIAAGPNQSYPFVRHMTEVQNPAHVGLGSVSNIATSTDAQAQNASDLNLHVTLRQLVQILFPRFLNPVQQNIQNVSQTVSQQGEAFNQHVLSPTAHSKAAVGLSNVQNLPIATDEEVQNKTPADKYVTLSQVLSLLQTLPPPEVDMETARYLSSR